MKEGRGQVGRERKSEVGREGGENLRPSTLTHRTV